jgi:catechol 2,3-dioxygenase-like lactoylglutathione lyase family enzyme
MQLHLSRVILFTSNMGKMVAFYRDVLGFRLKTNEKGWKTFDAGGCEIALHSGAGEPGARPPKLAFDVKDVAATREALMARRKNGQGVQQGRARPLQRERPRRQSVRAFEQRAMIGSQGRCTPTRIPLFTGVAVPVGSRACSRYRVAAEPQARIRIGSSAATSPSGRQ